MRVFLFVFTLLGCSNFINAQWGDSVRVKSNIRTSLLSDIGSNSFTVQNYRDFNRSSFLSPAFKNEIIDGSAEKLRLGSRQSFELAYRQLNDSVYSSWAKGFEINLSYNSVLGIASKRDVLKLILNGNSPYASEVLDLAPTKYQRQDFLSIGFRLIEERKSWSWSYGLSALFGTQFQDLNLERGTLYTEESGSYLDLNTQYTYKSADTLNPIKGMGIGTGGSVNHLFNDQLSFGLELRDFGIIFWNNASYTIEADTSFRYSGELIPNVLDVSGSLFDDTQQDLEDALLTKEGGSFIALTPFNLKANALYKHKNLGRLKSSEALIEYVYTPGFQPLFRVNSTWGFNRWTLSPDLSYGGFTGFGVGMRTNYETRYWQIGLHLFNAQGLILSSSKAIGAQLFFNYIF